MAKINAGEMAKELCEMAMDDFTYRGNTMREWIEILARSDIAEVVRCKDCKWYKFGKHFNDIKFCQRLPLYAQKGGLNTADDDFCSYGERKEE